MEKLNAYIGIDPSVNSTGICIRYGDTEHLYILKPDKLTKREQKFNELDTSLKYLVYNKIDLKPFSEENHLHEKYKTYNLIAAADGVCDIIMENVPWKIIDKAYIVQEGISYGSSARTKSVYDLAGLNYLLRKTLLGNGMYDLTIVPPSEIKKFATGAGNSNKDTMVALFIALHPELSEVPKCDDIADAFFMSEYAEYIYPPEMTQKSPLTIVNE